jgi:alcohol dehydrogenase class IV
MKFEFAAPGRIIFGPGSVSQAGGAAALLAAADGSAPRALVVSGARALADSGGGGSRAASLLASLEAAGIACERFAIDKEPRFEDARAALALARSTGCRLVVGFGGGSALDLAKAVAALLANPGDPLDYAEIIGGGRALSEPSYPCIAIPTTAGTGSEATRNAVLVSPEEGVKASLRSSTMLPRLAIIDPELSYGLPPRLTAETGMDALTQLLEPLVCSDPNSLVDAICREALPRAIASLPRAFRDGSDKGAREDMAFASLSGGMALANARLGAVHGFAAPLGGAFPIPHGAACAALLAPVASVNVAALRARDPQSPALARYAEVARMLTNSLSARPEDAGPALERLAAELGIRGLGSFGIEKEDFPDIARKAAAASSMRGNPVLLLPDELMTILNAAW